MTTNAECTAAAPICTLYAGFASLAGGNLDPTIFVNDGNGNFNSLAPSLTAAAAALTAIGQGGSHSANSSAQYLSWAASVQTAISMAQAAGDAISSQRLATAMQILNNLAAGV